jgi:hypothetical protein
MIEPTRTFFCSEIIAKAFKEFGIMEKDDISCSQYTPHNFSSSYKGLKLTEGTSIEQEKIIVFRQ